MRYLFQDTTFIGKRMLDIGGGTGLFSFYAGCCGARQVVCLEPEAEGSSPGMVQRFYRVAALLGCRQVSLHPIKFQDFDPEGRTFDIILLHDSVSHLDEAACMNLRHDGRAVETYQTILQKLSNMASYGARLIITDCSRHNFFAACHLKNPLGPKMEWHKHQSPDTWIQLGLKVGFCNPRVRWTSFNSLRPIGRWLLGNKIAAFFLSSHFCLTMDK